MGGMEAADRLRDPEWKGCDGMSPYDLILIAGITYSFCWTILSGIRNSAPGLKTIILDRKYQPHASLVIREHGCRSMEGTTAGSYDSA